MNKVYIVLEDNTIFEGLGFGAEADSLGELVFTTGMCGYIETLTDPSYYGQIVLQTFPLIGNYGIIEDDFEGSCFVKGYVVRDWCRNPSNFRCQYSLDEFLKKNNIPGVYGVDTRELTKLIREHGVMNAKICRTLPESLEDIKGYKIVKAVEAVSSISTQTIDVPEPKHKVVLIDYGAKKNILRELNKRGCSVTVVPSCTKASDIFHMKPDGIMLSNGPGDPAENTECIGQVKQLMGKVPVFGICLGHQLMALAMGGETIKLKYGHRGVNQPAKNVSDERTYITSQNHGYAVVDGSVKSGMTSFINANDGTCEGIDYPELSAFSVQFHPEACSGPHDTSFLFDRFITLMGGDRNA